MILVVKTSRNRSFFYVCFKLKYYFVWFNKFIKENTCGGFKIVPITIDVIKEIKTIELKKILKKN